MLIVDQGDFADGATSRSSRLLHCGDPTGATASDEEINWMISETNRCLPKLSIARNDILYTWAGVNPLTRDPLEPRGSREIKLHDMARDGLPGMLTLTGGPVMTHRRVARRIVGEVQRRLVPSGAPQSLLYESTSATSGRALPDPEEIARYAREEMPADLSDLMMRRLGLGWEPDQGLAQAPEIAEIAAPYMGWSRVQAQTQVRAYRDHLSPTRRRPG